MAVIAFFLLRGHSLNEMLSLSTAEMMVYRATYRRYIEEQEEVAEEMEKEIKRRKGGVKFG